MQLALKTSKTRLYFAHAALVVLALVWISPASWLVFTAFDVNASGAFALPSRLTLDHFRIVFQGDSARQFFNSVVISVASATITMVMAAVVAYPFSRMRIPFKNSILWSLVLLRILPSTAIIIPVFLTARHAGLLNQMGVILTMVLLNLPFAILLLKNFFDSVPLELEEAAYLEGARLSQIVRYVILPMARAGMAVVWFMAFTSTWNEFLFPFLMLRADSEFPMAVGLYAAFGLENAVNYGFLAAYSIIYAAPAIGVYFLLKRNLTTGFAGVGVKG